MDTSALLPRTGTALLPELATWFATTSWTGLAATALAGAAGLVAAYLAVVTLLYAGAVAARFPRAATALRGVTPAVLRRLADRAVAAALVTSVWAPAGTAVAAETGTLPPGLRVPMATTVELPERSPALELPTGPPGGVTLSGTAVVTVRAGDHLWGIAARHLADLRGTTVDALPLGDVARYWDEVVRLNLPTLRSGDADLIHPGEDVRLPPVG